MQLPLTIIYNPPGMRALFRAQALSQIAPLPPVYPLPS